MHVLFIRLNVNTDRNEVRHGTAFRSTRRKHPTGEGLLCGSRYGAVRKGDLSRRKLLGEGTRVSDMSALVQKNDQIHAGTYCVQLTPLARRRYFLNGLSWLDYVIRGHLL